MRITSVKKSYSIGIAFTLIAWGLIALQSAFITMAHITLPTSLILLVEFSILLIVNLVFCIRKGWQFLAPQRPYLVITRGVISISGFFSFIYCGILNSLTDASLLINTEALFVPLLLLMLYKKSIYFLGWFGLILGFIGVLLVYIPDTGFLNLGGLLGIAAGLASAIIILMSNTLIKHDPAIRIVFYHALIGTVTMGIFTIFHWQTPSIREWLYLILAGLALSIAMFLFIEAFKYANAIMIGGLSYSLVIFSGILQWIIWDVAPSLRAIFGYLLIVIGGSVVTYKNQKAEFKSEGK